jgi:chromosome segregation ATPase
MSPDAAEHLAHAASLEERDEAIAGELEHVRELAERAGLVRGRAAEVRTELERVPRELRELIPRLADADTEVTRARAQLETAERRVEDLERARRRKADELERARSEAATASEQFVDAERRLERLVSLEARLLAEQEALRAESAALERSAGKVAAEISLLPRVTGSAREPPPETLEGVEEWGARVRAALFVVQGTLETERERIVVEANALGEAVLGETLGASSVAVVRRRLEERLG